jgi:hypothetical protein
MSSPPNVRSVILALDDKTTLTLLNVVALPAVYAKGTLPNERA